MCVGQCRFCGQNISESPIQDVISQNRTVIHCCLVRRELEGKTKLQHHADLSIFCLNMPQYLDRLTKEQILSM